MKTLLLFALAASLYGQADISSAVVRGVWNAGSATRTAPFKIGTSPPGTCTVGDQFWDSDATAGSNLYSCTATNVWTLQAGGSGATAISGLTDLKVTKNSATDVVMAAGNIPCGSTVYAIAQTTFVHDTGTTTPVYVGIDCAAAGAVVLARGNNVMTSPTGYTSVTDINFDNYPNIIPIASITVASNDWGTVTDMRTLGSWAGGIIAGSGITIDKDSNGLPRIASTGSGSGSTTSRGAIASRPASGTTSGDVYYATDGIGLFSQWNGSSWADFYQGSPIVRPVAASNWTVVNGGTNTDANGFNLLSKAAAGLVVAVQAQADTAWTATIGFLVPYFNISSPSLVHECGIWATTGTTAGTHVASGVTIVNNLGVLNVLGRLYNPINGTITNNSISNSGNIMATATGGVFWLRLARSTTNFTAYVGDGYGGTWTQVGTGAHSLGGTPTHLGFGCDARGSEIGVNMKVIHWDVQ